MDGVDPKFLNLKIKYFPSKSKKLIIENVS